MKLKNIFLATALVAFALGFSDVGESVFWHSGRPIGAIFFGLFMIFNLLEKETALLDEQNGKREQVTAKNSNAKREKLPEERLAQPYAVNRR